MNLSSVRLTPVNPLPSDTPEDYDPPMTAQPESADYDTALPGAQTELAPSASETEAHTAWALDDDPEWTPSFWTAGRITGLAVAGSLLMVGVAAWVVAVTRLGDTEERPAPNTTTPTPLPIAPPAATVTQVIVPPPQPTHLGCADGQTKPGDGPGDYYQCYTGAWLHVVPTFDPNSGDGYGPNQPVPPLCVRFPDQYTC